MALFSTVAGTGALVFGGGFLGSSSLFLGFTGSAVFASVAATTLNVIVGVAATALIGRVTAAIMGKDQPKAPAFGLTTTLQLGVAPRAIIIGRGATAGSLVYANSWGKVGKTPNAYLTQVIALSDLPVRGLHQVIVNGEPCTLGETADPDGKGHPVLEYRDDNDKDHLWVKFKDGSQTAADGFLTGTVSSAGRPYDAFRRGAGVAYAIVTALINRELFSGYPRFLFVVDGVRLYDPSKDTTAGGSGAQRWSDPDTWGGDGDDLPAVQAYNLLRGIRYGGAFLGAWLYGLQQVGAAQLPPAHWIAQIEKCRAAIAEAGGAAPTYTSGGELSLGAEVGEALTEILSACNGRFTEAGGTYKIFVGDPGAPVMSFTDDDIISTSEQTFTPFFGLAETVNAIASTYPSASQAWQPVSAPTLFAPDLEAEDGDRRLIADAPLTMVSRDEQAQRLQAQALAEARRARRHTHVLPPRFWALEPGDVVQWTSARNGYSAKTFRVDGVLDQDNCDVVVDLTEIDASGFSWDTATDYAEPAAPPLAPVRPPVQSTSVSVEALTLQDGASAPRRPAIRLLWAAPEDTDAVIWQVRLAADGSLVSEGRADDPGDGEANATVISTGLLSSTAYEVRARWVPGSPRPVAWSAWLSVTTPDVPTDFDAAIADVVSTANAAQTTAAQAIDDASVNAAAILDRTTEAQAQSIADARIAVSLDTGGSAEAAIAAAVGTEETARIAGDAAAASRLDTIEASYETTSGAQQKVDAKATELTTTFTNADTALAQSVTDLSVSIGGVNVVRNASFELNTDYWFLAESTGYQWGRRDADSVFSGPGQLPLYVRRFAGASDQQVLLYSSKLRTAGSGTGWFEQLPVRSGEWVEASANIGAANCTAKILIIWRNDAGTWIGSSSSDLVWTYASRSPDDNTRLVAKGQTPVGATWAIFAMEMRGSVDTAADAYATLWKPMLSGTTQDAPTRKWSPSAPGDIALQEAWIKSDRAVLIADGVALAQDVQDQVSRLDGAEANISTLSTTTSQQGSSIASLTTTLNATNSTVSGLSSTVTTQGAAINDIEAGLSAYYGIKVKAGGALAFVDMLSDAELGSALVLGADSVTIKAETLDFDGTVRFNGDLILNSGTVRTNELADRAAALQSWSVAAGTGATAPVALWTDIRVLSFDRSDPAPVELSYSVVVENTLSTVSELRLRVTENGALVSNSTVEITLEPGQKLVFRGGALDSARAAVGNVTFALQLYAFQGGQVTGLRSLIATQLKKST